MSEKQESKRIKARLGINSGRGKLKGDAFWKHFTVDFKEVSKSFTLNKDVWAKAVTDAMKNRNDPMIIVVLGDGQQTVRLAIMELALVEQWEEQNGN